MMKSLFVCQQCGNEFSKWHGKCPVCGEWNSLVESVKVSKIRSKSGKRNITAPAKTVKLTKIVTTQNSRIRTNIKELDNSLGGGMVPGQVILLAGEPGIGKSTLLLQVASKIEFENKKGIVLYVSGEESAGQVGLRAKRLGINNPNIEFLESTNVDEIINLVNSSAVQLVIVDSIQTMATDDLTGVSGSVGQVRECTFRLLHASKSKNIPLILVGHVTKDGTVAGPSTLMHMVDTVLWFEGDRSHNFRLIRAVKNRFGPTDEVGIFTMGEEGLTSLENSALVFLEDSKNFSAGSALTVLMEGSRPILVEIQSLVVPTKLAFPRRVGQGIDSKKLEVLLAVLTRRVGINLYDMDVFVNVVGGIKANDPCADLAICMSLASSYYDKKMPNGSIAFGEVGLLGEIRKAVQSDKRSKEANKLGYTEIIDGTRYTTLKEVILKLFK